MWLIGHAVQLTRTRARIKRIGAPCIQWTFGNVVTARSSGVMIGGMRGAELCAGLALMVASGCHTWRERPVTAPDPSTASRTLRLTTNRGARRLTLERAAVRLSWAHALQLVRSPVHRGVVRATARHFSPNYLPRRRGCGASGASSRYSTGTTFYEGRFVKPPDLHVHGTTASDGCSRPALASISSSCSQPNAWMRPRGLVSVATDTFR